MAVPSDTARWLTTASLHPAAAAIVESFESIEAEPRRVRRPLRFELEGLWAARRGPYRVISQLDEREQMVTVIAVAHRADVYRRR